MFIVAVVVVAVVLVVVVQNYKMRPFILPLSFCSTGIVNHIPPIMHRVSWWGGGGEKGGCIPTLLWNMTVYLFAGPEWPAIETNALRRDTTKVEKAQNHY